MALDPYVPLPLPQLASPLLPILKIKFAGENPEWTMFPSPSNNIYIESATFDILNENGYSSASITLADPDYVNLDELFARALFKANSFSKTKLTWFCGVLWGWSTYGKGVTATRPIKREDVARYRAAGRTVREYGNDQYELERTEKVQNRTSGVHYYMLTDLSYDLTDVELRITFQLADVGSYIFGKGINEEGGTTVGKLKFAGVSHVSGGDSGTTSGSGYPDPTVQASSTVEDGERRIDLIGPSLTGGSDGSTIGDDEESEEPPKITNYIRDIKVWDAIKRLCREHKPPFEADISSLNDNGDPDLTDEENVKIEEIEIPEDMKFFTAIEKLLELIPRRPPVPENDEGEETGDDVIREKFGIVASDNKGNSKSIGGEESARLLFGWKIIDVPKKNQINNLRDKYRLARQFVYRPGSLNDITSYKASIVKSLSYDWTSRGYWNMHLPTVYAIFEDKDGQYQVFFNKEDYKSANPTGKEILKSDPSVGQISLLDAQDEVEGLKIHFNFDTRSQGVERYTQQANTIIINVWNFLAKELVTVNIEIAGDPWLDNTLFTKDGDRIALNDLLVDIYHSYFTLSVYKPNTGGRNHLELDNLLSGTYISIKGVSHKISEGDYTTSLQLIKVF